MENKINNQLVHSLLHEQFGEHIVRVEESYGMLDITVKRECIIDILGWLRDHTLLQFNFLTTVLFQIPLFSPRPRMFSGYFDDQLKTLRTALILDFG